MSYAAKVSMWESVRRLWTRFYGLAEDLRLLKDRWMYHARDLEPALPRINSTFETLEKAIMKIDRDFLRLFNFVRGIPIYPINLDGFRIDEPAQYLELEESVSNLEAYTGLLKLAFQQRTVSLEIPKITSGYPHSPERTVGNELVYIGADNVTMTFADTITHPSGILQSQWDGFVTFVPPITDELRYGAFCKKGPYGSYHIYMPEGAKYSITSYLLIAHEVGHISLLKPGRNKWHLRNEYENSKRILIKEVSRKIANVKSLNPQYCGECGFDFVNMVEDNSSLQNQIDEAFADIIGVRIGGIKTLEALLDSIPLSETPEHKSLSTKSFEIIMRANIVYKYVSTHHDRYGDLAFLRKRLTSLGEILKRYSQTKICLSCAKIYGKEIGEAILALEKENTGLFASFVDPKKEFAINSEEETRIICSLKDCIPCQHENICHILHCWMLASQKAKEHKERPSYPATLHSLAYNTSTRLRSIKENRSVDSIE
jgi:hypothetical protein